MAVVTRSARMGAGRRIDAHGHIHRDQAGWLATRTSALHCATLSDAGLVGMCMPSCEVKLKSIDFLPCLPQTTRTIVLHEQCPMNETCEKRSPHKR
jgi:hypothetical protein